MKSIEKQENSFREKLEKTREEVEKEIKEQTVITVENREEKIIAFLNVFK